MPLDLIKRSEVSQPLSQSQNDGNFTLIENFVNGLESGLSNKAPSSHTHSSDAITDATAAGRALMTASDAAAQRAMLGLGALATKSTVATTDVANNAVTLPKLQAIAGNQLLGRSTAGSGNVEAIGVGTGLSLSGGVLSATGGGTGGPIASTDITDSTAAGRAILTAADAPAQRSFLALGTLATKNTVVDADVDAAAAIALTKLQQITNIRLLGRASTANGPVGQISVGAGLSLASGVLSATGGGTGAVTTGRPQSLPYTLAASDKDQILSLTTSGGTLTVPAAGSLGGVAQVLLVNETAGNVTINGAGNDVVMAAGETATFVEVNNKQWIVRGPGTLIS